MPIKKNSEIKKSEGNRSKEEIKKDPVVKIELPEAPKFLNAIAKKEWKERGEELLAAGLISKIDFAAFAFYCDSFACWQELVTQLKNKKIVQENKVNGEQRVNLIAVQAEKYKESCLKYLTQFGMSPKARVGLTADLGAVNALDPYLAHQEKMKQIKKIK